MAKKQNASSSSALSNKTKKCTKGVNTKAPKAVQGCITKKYNKKKPIKTTEIDCLNDTTKTNSELKRGKYKKADIVTLPDTNTLKKNNKCSSRTNKMQESTICSTGGKNPLEDTAKPKQKEKKETNKRNTAQSQKKKSEDESTLRKTQKMNNNNLEEKKNKIKTMSEGEKDKKIVPRRSAIKRTVNAGKESHPIKLKGRKKVAVVNESSNSTTVADSPTDSTDSPYTGSTVEADMPLTIQLDETKPAGPERIPRSMSPENSSEDELDCLDQIMGGIGDSDEEMQLTLSQGNVIAAVNEFIVRGSWSPSKKGSTLKEFEPKESSISLSSVNVSTADNVAAPTPTKPPVTTETITDPKQQVHLIGQCVNNNKDVAEEKQEGLLPERSDPTDKLLLDSDFVVNDVQRKKKTKINLNPGKSCTPSKHRASGNKLKSNESSMSLSSVNVSTADNVAAPTPTKPLVTTETITEPKQQVHLIGQCVTNNEGVAQEKQEGLLPERSDPTDKLLLDGDFGVNDVQRKKKTNINLNLGKSCTPSKHRASRNKLKSNESSISLSSVNVSTADNVAAPTPTKPLVTTETITEPKQQVHLIGQCVNNNKGVAEEKQVCGYPKISEEGLLPERSDPTDKLLLDGDFGVNDVQRKKKTNINLNLGKSCTPSKHRASRNKLKSNESSISLSSVNVSTADNVAAPTPTKPLVTTETITEPKQQVHLIGQCVTNNEGVAQEKQEGLLPEISYPTDKLLLDSDFGVNDVQRKKKTKINPHPGKSCTPSKHRASGDKLKTNESSISLSSVNVSTADNVAALTPTKPPVTTETITDPKQQVHLIGQCVNNNEDVAEEKQKSPKKRPRRSDESPDSINLERKRKSSERTENEAEGKMTTSTLSDSTTTSSQKMIKECRTRQLAVIVPKLTSSDVGSMKTSKEFCKQLIIKLDKIQPMFMKCSPVSMKRKLNQPSPAPDGNAEINKRKYLDSYASEMQKQLCVKVLRFDEVLFEGQRRKEISDKCSSVTKDPIKNDFIFRLGGWDRPIIFEIDECEDMILESGRGELPLGMHLEENWELSSTPNRNRTMERFDENDLSLLGEVIEQDNHHQSLFYQIYSSPFDCNMINDVSPAKLDSKNKKQLEDLNTFLPLSRESSIRLDQPLHEHQHRPDEEQNNYKAQTDSFGSAPVINEEADDTPNYLPQTDSFGSAPVTEYNEEADYTPNYLPQTLELFSDLECFMNENSFDYQGLLCLANTSNVDYEESLKKLGDNEIKEFVSSNCLKDEQTTSIIDHHQPSKPGWLSNENLCSAAGSTITGPTNLTVPPTECKSVEGRNTTSPACPSAEKEILPARKNFNVKKNQIHSVTKIISLSADSSAKGGTLAVPSNGSVQNNQIRVVKKNKATSGASTTGGSLAVSKNLDVQKNKIHTVKENTPSSASSSALGSRLVVPKNITELKKRTQSPEENMSSSRISIAKGDTPTTPLTVRINTELKKRTQSPEENMSSSRISIAKGDTPTTPLTVRINKIRTGEVTKFTSNESTTPRPKLNKNALLRQNVSKRRSQIAGPTVVKKPMPSSSPYVGTTPENNSKTIRKGEDGRITITARLRTLPSLEHPAPLNKSQNSDTPNGCGRKLTETPNSVERRKPASEQITENSVSRKPIRIDPRQIVNTVKSKPFEQGKVLPANTKTPRKRITFQDDNDDFTNKKSKFNLPKNRIDIESEHKERVFMNGFSNGGPSSLGIKEHSFVVPKPVMPMTKLPPSNPVFANIARSATHNESQDDDDTGSIISLFVNSELEFDLGKSVEEGVKKSVPDDRRINVPGNNDPHTTKRTHFQVISNENNTRWDKFRRSDDGLMSEFRDEDEHMAEDRSTGNNSSDIANWVNDIQIREMSLPDTFSAEVFLDDSPLRGVCPWFLRTSVTSQQHTQCQLMHKVPKINPIDGNLCAAIEQTIKTGFCNPPHDVLQLFISACLMQRKKMTLIRIVKALNENNTDDEYRAKTIWKEFIKTFLAYHNKWNSLGPCPSTTLSVILQDTFTENSQIIEPYLKNLYIILNCFAEESKQYPSLRVLHCVDFLKDKKTSLHDFPLDFKIRVLQQVMEKQEQNNCGRFVCSSPTGKFIYKVFKSFFEPLENRTHVDQMYKTDPPLVKSYLETLGKTFPNFNNSVRAYLYQARRLSEERSPSLASSSLSSSSPFPQRLDTKSPHYRISSSPQSPNNPSHSSENPSPILNNPTRLSNNFHQDSDPPGWANLCKELKNLEKTEFVPKGLKTYLNACDLTRLRDALLRQLFDIFHGYSNGCSHYLQVLRLCSDYQKQALNNVTLSLISAEVKKKEWKVCYSLKVLLVNFDPTLNQDFLIARSPASKVFLIIEILLKNDYVKEAVEHFTEHKLYRTDPSQWAVQALQGSDMRQWERMRQDMTKALGKTAYRPVTQCSMLVTLIKAQRKLEEPIDLKNLVAEFLCELLESSELSIAILLVTEIIIADCGKHLLLRDPNHYRILIHRMVKEGSLQQAVLLALKARLRVEVYPDDFTNPKPEISFKTCLTDNEMLAIIRCKLKVWDDQLHQNLKINFQNCSLERELVQYLGRVDCSLAAALVRCCDAIKRLIPSIGSGLIRKGDSLVIDHIVCSNMELSTS